MTEPVFAASVEPLRDLMMPNKVAGADAVEATEDHVLQVRDWVSDLRASDLLATAEQLRDAVIDARANDAETCWSAMWNKPLYANTRVAIGERLERQFSADMIGAWCVIGLDPSIFIVRHDGKGIRANNFAVEGRLAQRLRSETGVAAHRLLAIQGAAAYLRSSVRMNGEQAPLATLTNEPLATLLPMMRVQLGRGWGPITVLHMLTDLGLAVKPDLHLVRSVQHLGLVRELKTARVLSERDAIRINHAVRELASAFAGHPATAADLRYMDKILMEASRQRLFQSTNRDA